MFAACSWENTAKTLLNDPSLQKVDDLGGGSKFAKIQQKLPSSTYTVKCVTCVRLAFSISD